MLSVQNRETWALSQANPKTKPIFHQTAPVCHKKRSLLSQTRRRFFSKNEACLSQKPSLFFQKRISPKSVTDFPKVGDRFPQNRRQISSKSVADFPKIDDGFPLSLWRISSKSVADFPQKPIQFPKPNQFIAQNRGQFFCSNKASLSLKRIFCCCFNLG